MAGLSYEELGLTIEELKKLLDGPSGEWLKEETILSALRRSYNYYNAKVAINEINKIYIIDAINSYAAWQCFGIYPVTISGVITMEDVSSYQTKLKHFQRMAEQSASLINVDLKNKSNSTDSNPVSAGYSGRSMLD